MNPLSSAALVALHEAKAAIVGIDGLEQRLRAAMRATRHHWMATNEEDRFKAAIGAVMLSYGEGSDEWKRLAWEVQQLGKISAMQQAALAGLSISLDSLDFSGGEPIGLLALWCVWGDE